MRKNHAELVCIIDRSGSMQSICSDAIGGFNAFMEGQRKVKGSASVTVVLFDDKYELLYDNVDLQVVKNLSSKTFVPRGSTALLDAIGRTINAVGVRLASMPEEQRPDKVMVCIITDGQENCSREFIKPNQIKEMIEHQRSKYSWEFAFLAANQDAFTAAGNFGISKQYTSNFAATGRGTREAYVTLDSFAANYRTN